MNPYSTTPDDAMDSSFEQALQEHFRSEAEPEDAGFSQRVAVALPARRVRRPVRWRDWVERAQWTAISLAGGGVAFLLSNGGGPVDDARSLAAWLLIALLVFWSVPTRWSRG